MIQLFKTFNTIIVYMGIELNAAILSCMLNSPSRLKSFQVVIRYISNVYFTSSWKWIGNKKFFLHRVNKWNIVIKYQLLSVFFLKCTTINFTLWSFSVKTFYGGDKICVIVFWLSMIQLKLSIRLMQMPQIAQKGRFCRVRLRFSVRAILTFANLIDYYVMKPQRF